ncbi:MAG: OadG family protein [Bacilli bacterium]
MLNTIIATQISVGDAAIYSLLSIVLVFAILLILIGVTALLFKWINMIDARKGKVLVDKDGKEDAVIENKPVEIKDDDMMVAVLVASIDYREEIKKDVKLVSVKEIK